MPELTLSVLDQSPLRQGGTAGQALRETIELAQAAERFGYRRFWVAEHHNTGNFAGTAPEVLTGLIAAATRTIRVGSGGVMLTHYSALKVAETFRILSALFGDRIDLGVGRAPGSDRRTAAALSHPRPLADVDAFPRQVADLLAFLHDRLPEGHEFAGISAQSGPPPEAVPEVWMLGSSDYGAKLAAAMGLPYAFADFFGYAGDWGPAFVAEYYRQFRPSEYLAEPRASVAVHVTCAETAERAALISSSVRLGVAQFRTRGWRSPLLPPEEALPIVSDPEVAPIIASITGHYIEGDPDTVRRQLLAVAERYGTTDLTIVTNCYSFADRVRSFELLAEVFNLRGGRAEGRGY